MTTGELGEAPRISRLGMTKGYYGVSRHRLVSSRAVPGRLDIPVDDIMVFGLSSTVVSRKVMTPPLFPSSDDSFISMMRNNGRPPGPRHPLLYPVARAYAQLQANIASRGFDLHRVNKRHLERAEIAGEIQCGICRHRQIGGSCFDRHGDK